MKELTKEETLRLISGRIMDEYRKHPTLDWSSIAATKIYSQWNEHYADEIAKLKPTKSEETNEAVTWDSIYIKYINECPHWQNKDVISITEWLKLNYNVPTRNI